MNINWNIEHIPQPPCVVSHILYGDVNRMKKNMIENKQAYISVRRRTKTTLDISLYYDRDDFAVAHIPAGAEKFKFVETADYSFFSSNTTSRYYFRISKKQNIEALKEYLSLVLNELELPLDTITVDMKIIGIEELKAA